ncbi:hypothetical protein PIROE2DRAFT_67130 [Piromyces sp. E2]|nr:hypothetical protein PIROE2DRAFT_67130 [Piromyces sp. E2]|eukprot:OUM66246.1 hypothetical protein PIROE2DRAFT_67130 [Piromyces sp. E2]
MKKDTPIAIFIIVFIFGGAITLMLCTRDSGNSRSTHEAYLTQMHETTVQRQNTDVLPDYNDVVKISVPPPLNENANDGSSSNQNIHLPTYDEAVSNSATSNQH